MSVPGPFVKRQTHRAAGQRAVPFGALFIARFAALGGIDAIVAEGRGFVFPQHHRRVSIDDAKDGDDRQDFRLGAKEPVGLGEKRQVLGGNKGDFFVFRGPGIPKKNNGAAHKDPKNRKDKTRRARPCRERGFAGQWRNLKN